MSLLNLFTVLFIVVGVVVRVHVVTCHEYGLELELLTIALNVGKSVDSSTSSSSTESLQFELEVEKRNLNNNVQHVLGNVALLAVHGRLELVFPEVPGKNPFHINRLESGDIICFRLQHNFDALLEDCRPLRDHATTYYSSEMYNKTLADGSHLIYKFSQYLLKEDDFSADFLIGFGSSTVVESTSARTETNPQTSPTAQSVAPLPVCGTCTVPIVFASLEAGILLLLILIGLYYFFCVYYKDRKSAQKRSSPQRPQPRPTISRPVIQHSDIGATTLNDGTIYDDSGVSSSASSHLDNNSTTVDLRPQDSTYQYDTNSSDMNGGRSTFSDNMKTIPNKFLTVNSKLSEASISMKNTLMATGQSLAQFKEKLNTKTRPKLKQDSTPPVPLPKDYPIEQLASNETYETESQFDDDDELYDVIELKDDVEETSVRIPKVPPNKPVVSYLHTATVVMPVPDASDARNKNKKFSYSQ